MIDTCFLFSGGVSRAHTLIRSGLNNESRTPSKRRQTVGDQPTRFGLVQRGCRPTWHYPPSEFQILSAFHDVNLGSFALKLAPSPRSSASFLACLHHHWPSKNARRPFLLTCSMHSCHPSRCLAIVILLTYLCRNVSVCLLHTLHNRLGKDLVSSVSSAPVSGTFREAS